MPKTYAVPPPPHHNEGKTVAAWTMNLGIVLGSLVIGAGMVLPDQMLLIWVGSGLVALAVLVGVVLSVVGLGQPKQYGHAAAEATAEGGANARGHEPSGAGAR